MVTEVTEVTASTDLKQNPFHTTNNLRSLVPLEIQTSKMAAILAAMRTGLRAIGSTIAASDQIVDKQGYNSLTALAELTDQTCANPHCSNLKARWHYPKC
jgi:hypothetical protein